MTRTKAIDRIRTRPRQFRVKEALFKNALQNDAGQICPAANALPNDHRRPIELAFFGGFTLIEIAGMLEVPVVAVKGRIRRGLLGLRDGLKNRLDQKVE
jgi:RNA polymerase sigma-70 factor (ECF subfamily)